MPREAHDVEGWIRRWEQQKSLRSTWDAHWQEVDEFFRAVPDNFTGQGRGTQSHGGGEKRTARLFDITAPLALERGAGGLASITIPQSRKWHRIRSSDEELNKDPSVKAWFEEVTRLLFRVRGDPKANWYTQAHEGMVSLLEFGNHCQFTDANPAGGIRYRGVHIGSIWVDIDHQRRVDTVFRMLTMSAKAAQQQWGHVWGDAPPGKIAQALQRGSPETFEFLHVVAPRKNVDPERLGPESMPWLSLYIFPAEKLLIEEGGFDFMPYQYARWSTSPSEHYGRGPGMTYLPGVKVLNSQERTALRAGHLAVDPPVLMSDDSVFGMGSRAPKFTPGASHFGMVDSSGRPRAIPFNTGADLQLNFEMMEAKRAQIQAAFNNDLFRILVETETMTATEVLERVKEKGQLLAPIGGRLESEWFGPQIHAELSLLEDQGRLPPLPPVMVEAGAGYEVVYDSPLSQMVRSEELVAIQRSIEVATPFVAVDPKKLELFDYEEIMRLHVEVMGGPSKALRTPEQYAEVLAQMQQAEAQAAQLAQMEQMAGAAKDGTGALAQLQQGGAQGGA